MMTGWDNFFVAEVGASAALAGLIFVGVSILRILAHLARMCYDYYTTATKDIDTTPQRATY